MIHVKRFRLRVDVVFVFTPTAKGRIELALLISFVRLLFASKSATFVIIIVVTMEERHVYRVYTAQVNRKRHQYRFMQTSRRFSLDPTRQRQNLGFCSIVLFF